MGRTGREPPGPGDEVPGDCPNQGGNDEGDGYPGLAWVKGGDVNNSFSDGLSHCRAEEERSYEMGNGGQAQSASRAHCPRGDNGRHHIGRIVETIGVIKEEGQPDDEDGKQKDQAFDEHPPFMTVYLFIGMAKH